MDVGFVDNSERKDCRRGDSRYDQRFDGCDRMEIRRGKNKKAISFHNGLILPFDLLIRTLV